MIPILNSVALWDLGKLSPKDKLRIIFQMLGGSTTNKKEYNNSLLNLPTRLDFPKDAVLDKFYSGLRFHQRRPLIDPRASFP